MRNLGLHKRSIGARRLWTQSNNAGTEQSSAMLALKIAYK